MYGKNLKQLRKNIGLTQFEVSKRTGIPQTTIGAYERGVPKKASYHIMKKLADFYGVRVNSLFYKQGYKHQEEKEEPQEKILQEEFEFDMVETSSDTTSNPYQRAKKVKTIYDLSFNDLKNLDSYVNQFIESEQVQLCDVKIYHPHPKMNSFMILVIYEKEVAS